MGFVVVKLKLSIVVVNRFIICKKCMGSVYGFIVEITFIIKSGLVYTLGIYKEE